MQSTALYSVDTNLFKNTFDYCICTYPSTVDSMTTPTTTHRLPDTLREEVELLQFVHQHHSSTNIPSKLHDHHQGNI